MLSRRFEGHNVHLEVTFLTCACVVSETLTFFIKAVHFGPQTSRKSTLRLALQLLSSVHRCLLQKIMTGILIWGSWWHGG